MGTNCHILIERPMACDDNAEAHNRNLCIMAAADVRWSSHDGHIREEIGVPNNWNDCFWEHMGTTEEYERIYLAARAHKDSLWKQREALTFGDTNVEVDVRYLCDDDISRDIDRTEEWLAYYELAFVLSQLGHKVICYGA